MSVRGGVLVTGTEVLTGLIVDRNGPWLSERLSELGIDCAHVLVTGDRPADIEAGLRFFRDSGLALVVTSGGLGPTADDLTAEVVGRFQGREMVLDEALEERIAEILRPLAARYPSLDMESVRDSNRKQAVVPEGAEVLDPVGTAPGLVVTPAGGGAGPTVVVLPGPPRELQPMWGAAVATEGFRAVAADAETIERGIIRLFGIPESEIAATLRLLEEDGIDMSALEITTCLRRGEIEIATRFDPAARQAYETFASAVCERHADTLFSADGETIDAQVARLLAGPPELKVATAESCTGGLLAARLTERAGSSAYVLGGAVAYADEAKAELAGVPRDLIARHGAVSEEVAEALATGARERLGADVGVGITGIAGPGGGSEAKPVGTVCFHVAGPGDAALARRIVLPGGRADVRDRATTVAMHLLRRALIARAA